MASLVAMSDVRVLELHKPAFEAILRERPETALAMMRPLRPAGALRRTGRVDPKPAIARVPCCSRGRVGGAMSSARRMGHNPWIAIGGEERGPPTLSDETAKEAATMPEHTIGTREEWQAARDELAKLEEQQAELDQKVTEQRRQLPWVPVEKERVRHRGREETLAELFDGRSQLLAYNIMFGPDYERGACPGCSMVEDELGTPHLCI